MPMRWRSTPACHLTSETSMMHYDLILPALLTWGSTTATLVLLTLTDTCDAVSMFSRRGQ